MLRRYNRLLVAFYVAADALLGLSAFIIAYTIRFHTGLIPITSGSPLRQYLNLCVYRGLVRSGSTCRACIAFAAAGPRR
jgi:hypothetical protein